MVANRPASPGLISVALKQLLAEKGPLDEADLTQLLVERGIDLGTNPSQRVLEALDESIIELEDGRLVDLGAVTEGVVLTHILTREEIISGRVEMHPDFSPLDDLADAGLTVAAAGRNLEHVHDEDDDVDAGNDGCLLEGPEGWLGTGASEGDLLVVSVTGGKGSVELRGSGDASPSEVNPGAVEALRAAYAVLTEDDDEPGPVDTFSVWIESVATEPTLFGRASAPLRRLLEAADLETRNAFVAPAGFEWDVWTAEQVVDRVADVWRLDEASRDAFLLVSAAYAKFDEGVLPSDHQLWAGLAAMLSHGKVAEAFVGEELEGARDVDGSVAAFAARAAAAAKGPARAGPLWVSAVCAERAGRTLEADAMVSDAVAADPTFGPALEDAAWYAADRGDARRAASLLRRTDDDAYDHILSLYERFGRSPAVTVGRNEQCPCGSGRKYKHCHLGAEMLPLTERCAFLYQKGSTYIQRPLHRGRLFDIAATLIGGARGLAAVEAAVQNPLVCDLALFEDGGWSEFVRDRGMLLPVDELFLAQQWELVERSVFEVEAVRPGAAIVVRDVRTGDITDVRERSGSRSLTAGELICCRVMPDGEGHQIFGGIERVSLRQRDWLIEVLDRAPDGLELAACFAAAGAPPVMLNQEREPLVLVTITYEVEDPASAASALDADELLETSGSDEWIEFVDTQQMGRTIRGFVRIVGTTVTVEANSELRADRLRAHVEALIPGLRLIDDVRVPAAEAMADPASLVRDHEGLTGSTPELAEFLQAVSRDYEDRWLDMSIPALAGLTPREAAADPTRREDLVALLDEFDRQPALDGPAAASMDVDRLRQALGILPR